MTRLLLLMVAPLAIACRPALPAPQMPLSATPAGRVPELAQAPEAIEAPLLPRAEVYAGPNGATLWVHENPRAEEVTVSVVTRRGADGAYPHGLLRFALHRLHVPLLSRYPNSAPSSKATLYGASLSARTRPDEFSKLFWGLLGSLRDPAYEPDDLDDARRRMRRRLERLSDGSHLRATLAAVEHLEGNLDRLSHAHRPSRDRIEGYKRQAMVACLHERFAPEDLVVIVSGPVHLADVIGLFDASFGAMAPGQDRVVAPERAPARPARALLSQVTRGDRAHVLMVQEAPALDHADRPGFELLTDLLGGAFSSLLNGSLREQHAYTYGAFATIRTSYYRDVLLVASDFQPERVDEALRELFSQLARLRSEPLSAERLAVARSRIWSHLRWRAEHRPARLLRDLWMTGISADDYEARYAALSELTPEDAMALARRTLDPTRALLVVTGDFTRVSGFLVTRDREGFHLTED